MTAKQRKLMEMNKLPSRKGQRMVVEDKQEEVRVCVCVCLHMVMSVVLCANMDLYVCLRICY